MHRLTIVRTSLQIEGLVLFAAAVMAYIHLQGSLWGFLALILVPDISMVGYLKNTSMGALAYNLVHVGLFPCLLLAIGLSMSSPIPTQIALIWLAHIGMDRTVGYGLKYPTAFKDTHLQRV